VSPIGIPDNGRVASHPTRAAAPPGRVYHTISPCQVCRYIFLAWPISRIARHLRLSKRKGTANSAACGRGLRAPRGDREESHAEAAVAERRARREEIQPRNLGPSVVEGTRITRKGIKTANPRPSSLRSRVGTPLLLCEVASLRSTSPAAPRPSLFPRPPGRACIPARGMRNRCHRGRKVTVAGFQRPWVRRLQARTLGSDLNFQLSGLGQFLVVGARPTHLGAALREGARPPVTANAMG